MNPLFMWLRAHPAERLAIVIVCLVGMGIGWQVWLHGGTQTTAPQPTASAAPIGTTPSPTPLFGSTPGPQQLGVATDSARHFLEALETYRYDDNPRTQGERVRPYVSDSLFSTLFSQPSNAHSTRPDLHEIDTPTVTKLTPQGFAADGKLGFLARVSVERKTDQGTKTEEHAYELFLLQQGNGWKVNDFTPGAGV